VKWNQGNRDGACDCYTNDVTFINSKGRLRGKKNLIERYRDEYPNANAMGKLGLRLLEFLPAPGICPTMATGILLWEVKLKNGKHSVGYCLETYILQEGEVRVAQDATITIWPKPKRGRAA
jgi:hypothetical protein